ncbi:MAG: DNA primase [Treponema sp.]
MPRITNETIEAINTHIDLVSLVEEYTHLQKRGHDWWGCCPFHNEKTPSFHVIPDKKVYYCFGCGAGGSTIQFFMNIEKLSFAEAIEKLARKAGITVSYADSYVPPPQENFKDGLLELYERVAGSFHYLLTKRPEGRQALQYLQGRQVSMGMIETFKLGYAPANRQWLFQFLQKKGYSSDFLSRSGLFSKKNPQASFFSDRIIYPICNRHGQVIAFGGRIINGEGPKYLNTGDLPQYKKGETLFAFSHALAQIRKTKTVILCEGYMDVIAFHQAGVTNAVAPLGTALTEQQLQLVHTFADTAVLAFDSDSAGQAASYKAIKLCRKSRLQVRMLYMGASKDPAALLADKGCASLTEVVKNVIMDDEYLVRIAINRFNIETAEGKMQAASFLFPYIDALEFDIQREAALNKFSADLGISSQALFTDYAHYCRKRDTGAERHNVLPKKERPVLTMTAELRMVLAVAANSYLFKKMRTQLTSDDFEDSYAKDLFIVLEECYREEAHTYDSLLAHCSSEVLRNAVSHAIINGEFAENAEKLVDDGIYYIKQNTLQRKKDIILRKLQTLRGADCTDGIQQMNELLNEKLYIDKMLSDLKEIHT